MTEKLTLYKPVYQDMAGRWFIDERAEWSSKEIKEWASYNKIMGYVSQTFDFERKEEKA